MKKVIIGILIAVAAFALIFFILDKNKQSNDAKTALVAQGGGAVSVRVAPIKKEVINLDFSANGNFIPTQEINFSAENAGRVTRIFVEEGSRVSKGQVLARIDAEILSTDRATAEATYQNALRDQNRYESSFKTGGVTQQQLDQARLATQNAKLKLQQEQRKLSDANIRSSISGVVNKKMIEVGAVVAAGTELFEIVDVSKLKLQVNVNEGQVALLKLGDKVSIRSSVFPQDEFSGKITFIAAKADNSLNFPIEIEVANTAKNVLKAGMYGTAVFKFPSQGESITVPRGSFAGSVSSNQVYVLENGKTAKLRKVVAGRILGDKVEILDGLKEGETVITSGQINLVDGAEVNPIK